MRILYHETTAYPPVSPLFIEALDESGWEYELSDEARFIGGPYRSIGRRIAGRLLPHPPGYYALNRDLIRQARRLRPDVLLVCKGAYISPRTLAAIKRETGAFMVNYATDDPFRNNRANTADIVSSLTHYDLYLSTKRAAIRDLERSGCRAVGYVRFGFKPSIHFPEPPATDEEKSRFASDLVFIGACDEDRAPIFEALCRAMPDLKLRLFGGAWNRSSVLRRYHGGLAFGRDFRLAIGAAKICLNLVRRSNRDDHVMRTFEIPACGGFMLAERTGTHLALFEEGREAGYFDSIESLIDQVRYYLVREDQRRRIAAAGHARVLAGGHTYQHRFAQIMDAVRELREPQSTLDGSVCRRCLPEVGTPFEERRGSVVVG